jgi:hypothetical protein
LVRVWDNHADPLNIIDWENFESRLEAAGLFAPFSGKRPEMRPIGDNPVLPWWDFFFVVSPFKFFHKQPK